MRADAAAKPPTALQKALLVFASALVALLLAELLARFFDNGRPRFGQQVLVREVPTRVVDGVALWSEASPRASDADIQRAADHPDAFTIVGLGDSIMYGVLNSKDETYLEQARRILATRTKQPVEIINLAVPGFNTMQENAVLKEVADRIRPDLVIIHYWSDDAHQYRVVGGYVVDLGNISDDGRLTVQALPLPDGLSEFLLVHSRLYALLSEAIVAHKRRGLLTDWTRVSKPLAEIRDRAQRVGGRLLVLASADLSGPSPRPADDLPMLQQFATTHGIEVIDVSEWIRDIPSREIAVDGCHFNARGHRILGEHLAEYLLQHDLKR